MGVGGALRVRRTLAPQPLSGTPPIPRPTQLPHPPNVGLAPNGMLNEI